MTYEYGDEFQRHVLAVLARIPGAILRYRSALDHTYFGSQSLRSVAQVLFAHVDEHRALPQKPTLFEEVQAAVDSREWSRIRKSVLLRIYREDVSDAQAVLGHVVDFGRQQAYVNATVTAAEMIDRGKRDVEQLFREAGMVGEDLLDIGADYRDNLEERQRYYEDPSSHDIRLRTGVPHLDFMLEGGLCRGELGVLLAPPKRGKTTALVNFGFGALTDVSGLNVVHYSLEMVASKILRRYDDRLMGTRVHDRKKDPKKYNKELERRVDQFVRGNLFVKHWPTRTASVSTVRSHLGLLQANGFEPDIVVVDYGDIVKPERRLGDMRHEQAGIYEDLRQLAGDFGVVVWTASQTSKSALDKDTITIADFAESFEKAAIADAVVAVCQTDDEKIDGILRLFGAAFRDAEDGRTVECAIDRASSRIRSIALYDVAGTRTYIDHEDEQNEEETHTEKRQRQERRRKKVSAVKEAVGLKTRKKGRKVRRKVSEQKPRVVRGKKVVAKKKVARKRDRPTKKVEA